MPTESTKNSKKWRGINTPPFFTLVFVNYQSADHLREALFHLYQKEGDSSLYEVIVVNNDHRERGLMTELEREFPALRIVESPKNAGFGSGNNLGAKVARGTVLGFLNPDLVWKEMILSEMQKRFVAEETLGVAGPTLLTEAGSPEPWSGGLDPTLFQILKNNLGFLRGKEMASKGGQAQEARDWVSGAALFIRHSLFRKLAGFDERFFLYFEDVDLCRRTRAIGFRVQCLLGLSVFHKSGKSQTSLEEQKKHFYRSQALYFQKHFSRASYFFLRTLRFLRHGF